MDDGTGMLTPETRVKKIEVSCYHLTGTQGKKSADKVLSVAGNVWIHFARMPLEKTILFLLQSSG